MLVLYLATSPSEPLVADLLDRRRIGLMCQPGSNSPRVGWWWAADNGCYSPNRRTPWDEARWRRWLERDSPRVGCLFAAVPDVVGDHVATGARFKDYAETVRAARYPVAFVAQDGLTPDAIPLDEIDCLFVGGSTTWKMGHEAFACAETARAAGRWVHVGRVNSGRRYHAWAPHADSADGTLLAYGPATNLPDVEKWLDHHDRNPQLGPISG